MKIEIERKDLKHCPLCGTELIEIEVHGKTISYPMVCTICTIGWKEED